MTVSVAALGSCVSRDPFNTLFNPSYKDFFRVDAYQFQMSLISLMAPPISYQSKDYQFESEISENSDWHFRTELNKRFLNDLVAASPDYLILDFYTDILFGVVKVERSYVSNKKNVFSKNKLWKSFKLGDEINVQDDFDRYFRLFKQSVASFMKYKERHLPDTKIVVNKARFTNQYWDDVKKEIVTFGNKTPGHYERLNQYWNMLDDYVIQTYQTESLSFDKTYYADPHYRYGGLHTVHYKNNFYEDFQLKLLRIVFNDLIEKKLEVDRKRTYYGNLLQNGDFSLDSASWKIFKDDIFKLGHKKIKVSSFGNTINQWNQMVSDPIENLGEKQTYRLDFSIAFDKKTIGMIDLDDPIVKVRTFHKRNLFKAADAEQEINLTKEELLHSLPSGKGKFTKELILEGRYIKVIPYLKKNGSYQISAISLCRIS